MIARSYEKYLRISPRKLALIADLIRRKKVEEALGILVSTNKKGARILQGVVESALSNAKRVAEKKFAAEDLYISRVIVDMGPSLKRFRAMTMGRAGQIRKRTSHVLVELDAPRKAPAKKAKPRKKGLRIK